MGVGYLNKGHKRCQIAGLEIVSRFSRAAFVCGRRRHVTHTCGSQPQSVANRTRPAAKSRRGGGTCSQHLRSFRTPACPRPAIMGWARNMPNRITSELLFLLNNLAEVKEHEWNEIEVVMRPGSIQSISQPSSIAVVPENRFAATVCSGLAKFRSVR